VKSTISSERSLQRSLLRIYKRNNLFLTENILNFGLLREFIAYYRAFRVSWLSFYALRGSLLCQNYCKTARSSAVCIASSKWRLGRSVSVDHASWQQHRLPVSQLGRGVGEQFTVQSPGALQLASTNNAMLFTLIKRNSQLNISKTQSICSFAYTGLPKHRLDCSAPCKRIYTSRNRHTTAMKQVICVRFFSLS